jgi:drug/metabolite transporter (DMT)-like permease
MALQDAIVKLTSSDMTLWQLFTLRGCISLLILAGVVFAVKDKHKLWPSNVFWSLIRSSLLVLMYATFYISLFFVDLSMVAGLYYTGPIFIVVLSWLLLKQKINWLNIISIVLGFAAVVIIIVPGSVDISVAIVLPILSAIFYALAMITTKGKCQHESLTSLVISLNIAFVFAGGIISAIIYWLTIDTDKVASAPFLLGDWVQFNAAEWGILCFLAVLNISIHLLLARAYKMGNPAVIAGFDYSYLAFAVLWGWVLLSETPSITTVIGILVIAVAGIAPIVYDKNARKSNMGLT